MSKKIIHITRSMVHGGSGRVALTLALSQTFVDFDFHIIFSLFTSPKIRKLYEKQGVKTHYFAIPMLSGVEIFSYRLSNWLRTLFFSIKHKLIFLWLRPSLIHLHTYSKWASHILEEIYRFRIPLILTIHNMGPLDTQFTERFIDFLQKTDNYFVTFVSEAVYLSSGIDKFVPRSKVAIIYNGIDLKHYTSDFKRNIRWRLSYQIPLDAFVFGASGRIIELKRFDLFIEASKKIFDTGRQTHFFLVGQGNDLLEETYRSRIKELGLQDYFHFLGWQNDVRDFLSNLNVFVQCSDEEGFSLALLEACAMGIPCISTNVGGIPEIFAGAVMFINPGSVDELANAMINMMSYDNLHFYSKKGIERAQQYSSEKMARNYRKVYELLLD